MADLNADILKALNILNKRLEDLKNNLASGGGGAMNDGKQVLFNQTEIAKIMKDRFKLESDINKLSKSNNEYAAKLADNLKNVSNIEKSIQNANKRYAKLANDTKLSVEQRAAKMGALLKVLHKKNEELEKERELIDEILEREQEIVNKKKEQVKYIKKSVEGLFDMNKAVLKVAAGAKTTVKSFFETDAILRESAKSIGLNNSEYTAFVKSTSDAVANTATVGGNFKDLAKFQSSYTTSIGRSVMLSGKQMENVSYLANGTVLGADGAAELAANMEMVGVGVDGSVKSVETLLQRAEKFGVDGAAATKKFQENLKLAQSYNFAGGIKGIQEMAIYAAKFKVDMNSIGSMADKAFNVEGAVEMAARFNMLGGSVSRYLGDWNTLLYDSRENIEDLTDRSSKAMGDYISYNSKKQMYEMNGLGKSFLKQIAEASGQSYEALYSQAIGRAQTNEIESKIKIAGLSQQDKDLLTSKTSRDINGNFQVATTDAAGNTTMRALSQITLGNVEAMKKEAETLKQRAEKAASFDTMWNAIFETFKAELVPALSEMRPVVADFVKGIVPMVQGVGKMVGAVVSFIGPTGLGILAGLGSLAVWAANGAMFGNTAGTIIANKVAMAVSGSSTSGGGGGGSLIGGMSRNMKIGGALGLGGAVVGIGNSALKANGAYAAGSGWDVGASALSGAATGAGMGMMFGGPWGALAGSVIGAGMGAYTAYNSKIGDGIVRSDGSVTRIDSKDTVLAARPNGPIDKVLSGNNTNLSGGGSVEGNIALSPLRVEGSINLTLNGDNIKLLANELLKDSAFVNQFTTIMQKTLRSSTNGGMLQPAPLK